MCLNMLCLYWFLHEAQLRWNIELFSLSQHRLLSLTFSVHPRRAPGVLKEKTAEWQAGAQCSQVIGVGACRHELLAFSTKTQTALTTNPRLTLMSWDYTDRCEQKRLITRLIGWVWAPWRERIPQAKSEGEILLYRSLLSYYHLNAVHFKGTWESSWTFKNSINCPCNLDLSSPPGALKSWNDLSELTHQFLCTRILLRMLLVMRSFSYVRCHRCKFWQLLFLPP